MSDESSEAAWLRHSMGVITTRARVEASVGAPGQMIATYVSAEAMHALRGHTLGAGVDCIDCLSSLTERR